MFVKKEGCLVLGRLRGQGRSQIVVVDALGFQDVQKVLVESLDFLEGSGIGPGEVFAQDRKHDITAGV